MARGKNSTYRVKAVIFDMDGVITNTMPDHYRAWRTILKEEGIDVSHYDVYSREGQRGLTSIREIFRSKQRAYHPSLGKVLLARKEELFKRIARARFIPGARPFLRALHRTGIRLGLVTGTSRHELHRILPADIYELFSVVVTGNDVKHGKPHPQPYRLALRKMRLNPDEAMVIENAPFGILSARGAGLACLAVATSLPRKHLKDADAVYDSVAELTARVRFLGNGKNERH